MMHCWSLASERVGLWFRDYERVQAAAVLAIYIQIGCALVGALGALFTGVLLVNLVLALFALVAIESSSQNLGRTYAILLGCSIWLDVMWFILFSNEIWNISSEKYESRFIFSVRLTLWMQIMGFSVRLMSSLLWIQMYRLGASCLWISARQEANFHLRSSFLDSSYQTLPNAIDGQNSPADDILGVSYSTYYSSHFQGAQDNEHADGVPLSSADQDNEHADQGNEQTDSEVDPSTSASEN